MRKIVITGGAGLVGQNLVYDLERDSDTRIAVLDKHAANAAILRQLHPGVEVISADLTEPGNWSDNFAKADAVVILHAQIGGLAGDQFHRNNVIATQRVIEACHDHRVPYICHISSSVVGSQAVDFYTESKRAQEALINSCGIRHSILRPTLMFGWFDRKHLGWLARFMKRSPVFPVPGHGKYIRQPLYVLDFCAIIQACLSTQITGTYDISGNQRVEYINLMRQIAKAVRARTLILPIPYTAFEALLRIYSWLDPNPPFTVKQLEALVIPEEFPIIDWPKIFGVAATPLAQALAQTFQQKPQSDVVLKF